MPFPEAFDMEVYADRDRPQTQVEVNVRIVEANASIVDGNARIVEANARIVEANARIAEANAMTLQITQKVDVIIEPEVRALVKDIFHASFSIPCMFTSILMHGRRGMIYHNQKMAATLYLIWLLCTCDATTTNEPKHLHNTIVDNLTRLPRLHKEMCHPKLDSLQTLPWME